MRIAPEPDRPWQKAHVSPSSPACTDCSSAANSSASVIRVIDLKTQHIGPDELLVAGKIEFDGGLDNAELSDAIDVVESAVRASVPLTMQIYLEPDFFDPDYIDTADVPSTH